MSRDDVRFCLREMSHRGPDANGIEEFTAAKACGYLGHVRLSIIDLAGGKQPMCSANGSLLLSFNGEIYNYLALKKQLVEKGHNFFEQSDTEVLLHAYQEWGESCVDRLRGMFAFAIWDANENSLFIARDQFGKKPLFYMQHEGTLYFASEIKALQKVPGLKLTFNSSQLNNYAIYRYVPSPDTFIDQIHKLPAGSYLVWKCGDFQISRYFVPPDADAVLSKMAPEQAVKKFWDILDESVELRMSADVPFGAFLSGGIDSSAIVALMSKHSAQKVKTFSIGFKEGEYSELGYAAVIAEQFETDHQEFVVSQDDLMELLPEVIRYRDAPVCEPSDIPIYMLAKEASKTVKMVLTGEGSDEILGGYPKHSYERLVAPFQFVSGLLRHKLVMPLINTLPYRFRRAKTAVRNMNIEDYNERMPGWFGALSADQTEKLIKLPGQAPLPQLQRSSCAGSLHDILLFDQQSWLPDNLLERGDRMTMAASIEARMPFMDIELAKFVATLPDKYKIRGLTTKWILRKAMESVLPKEILDRPKVGFRVPVNIWFQSTMKDYLCEHLLGENSISKAFYHLPVLQSLVSEHVEGRQNHEKTLWMLLNLEIWLRQNQNKISIWI
jgi:asparagine synthase (glutamine-hydrolysing)